jgi:hypothetical protein
MPRGRPPYEPFDPDERSPVRQAVATVDDRGRFKLPIRISEGVEWLNGRETLAILRTPGVIRLRQWEIEGEAVLRRRRELIEEAKSDPALLEIVRALEDRYKRFRIPPSGRPTLTDEMLLHLSLKPSVPASIYVWCISDTIELASTDHRIVTLATRWEELDGLP